KLLSGLQKNGYPDFKSVVLPQSGTPPAGSEGKALTSTPGFLSVDPDLKRLLNSLDDPANPPMVIAAEKFDPKAYDTKQFKPSQEHLAKMLEPIFARTQYLGLNVTAFNPGKLTATITLVGKTPDEARAVAV